MFLPSNSRYGTILGALELMYLPDVSPFLLLMPSSNLNSWFSSFVLLPDLLKNITSCGQKKIKTSDISLA